jgi:CRISPR-associated endonuclease Csn1
MTVFKRLSLDLGTNSLGWAMLTGTYPDGWVLARNGGTLDAPGTLTDVLGAGVRIFTDGRNPKDGKSLAQMRRGPRAARRRRDRFLQRQRGLNRLLRQFNIPLPPNVRWNKKRDGGTFAPFDPLMLRAKGLDHALRPEEFGRALWHLNQRRGFKSNRKTDGGDKDKGVVKQAQDRLTAKMTELGTRTLGEWLHANRHQGARFRQSPDPKIRFDFYPSRAMVEAEFDLLWAIQAKHHPALLNDVARDAIRHMIFYQRPLKKPMVGKCTFNPHEERAPKALPSVEAREIYERLNSLRHGHGLIRKTPIDRVQRDALATALIGGDKVSWDKVRRVLKLPADAVFNLEDLLKELPISKTAARMKKPDAFGPIWLHKTLAQRDAIMMAFIETEDESELAAWLVAEHGFDPARADKLASQSPGEDGYGRLGVTANAQILEQLIADHEAVYSTACERAGYHHSDFRTGEVMDALPYYGEVLERHIIDSDPMLREAVAAFKRDQTANKGTSQGKPHARKFEGGGLEEAQTGRIPNPTVHIGLNQLRRVINAVIAQYGPPDEIVLELSRELKMNEEQKKKADQTNRKNRERNEQRRKIIEEEFKLPVNGETMMRFRLWDEQMVGGLVHCPYTLKAINLSDALGGVIEVDHILPFSKSYDDSMGNKVLCYRQANRAKRNQSPAQAFSGDPLWPQILAHAANLKSRSWRFGPDAMEKFKDIGGFLGRQLNETKHLSKVAKTYLECLTPNVWVVTGQMTALLRGKWQLNGMLSDDNRKNRNDHRHHAIDAIVIGCTSRALLGHISANAGRAEEQDLNRLFGDFPEPMPDFRNKAIAAVNKIIVSHKPEHGKGGALHKDTAYGLKVREEEKDIGDVVYRVSLYSITMGEASKVRDKDLREIFAAFRAEASLASKKEQDKTLQTLVRKWADEKAKLENAAITERGRLAHRRPMRHVRVLKVQEGIVPIADPHSGEITKGVIAAENWCVDIVSVRDKKGKQKWLGFGATIFDANRKGWRPEWEAKKLGALLVMRLHKGDLIELTDDDGERRVKRVVQIEASNNRMRLALASEAGKLQERHDAKEEEDPFRWDLASFGKLLERNARKLKISEAGEFHYAKSNASIIS